MRYLTAPISISERIIADVQIGPAKHSSSLKGGTFILAKNANLLSSDGFSAHGCFSAFVNGAYSIDGEFVAIHLPGIGIRGTKISAVNADTPGDLSYIDGCSNSNLISPGRNGEPCTNYLYFPPNIDQTHHTHPSFRLGVVLSGKGQANLEGQTLALKPGDVFLLPRFVRHGFSTPFGESMSLMVFHPDSDDGPTDEHNPMKRRTYL